MRDSREAIDGAASGGRLPAWSEDRQRTLLRLIPDIVWCMDAAGRFLFVSPSIETVTGLTPEEMYTGGLDAWFPRLHPDDAPRARKQWAALCDDGARHDAEYRFQRADGRWIWLHSRAVVIHDGGPAASVYGIVSDVTERRQASDIRSLLLRRAMSAQEEERRRIARELHDDTAQSLASLLVGLNVLRSAPTLRAARDRAQALCQEAARALDEVRLLARGLRPSVLDDLGLLPALEWYAAEFERSRGVHVFLRAGGIGPRLPAPVETALYRIMQEALANVARHAEALAASVVLERQPLAVSLAISDDGRGFDVAGFATLGGTSEHSGLHGMRERAALLQGSLQVSSLPGAGTRVLVEIPLPEDRLP